MADRSVEEIVKQAEETTAQAQKLMENIARHELRSELAARGLHPENLTDADLDVFAEGIAEAARNGG